MENNYINTIYNQKDRPITSYPDKLACYLIDKFNIKKGDNLLDCGCGRGDFLNAFQNQGINCKGIDLYNNGNNIIYECNFENEKFPFPSNYFDICFSKSVVEHLNNPDNYMKEIYRILKPNGKLILMIPDYDSCMFLFWNDHTHKQPYRIPTVNDLLKICKFKNIQTELFYQLPIIWKYPMLKIVCKILQLFGAPRKIVKNKILRWGRELMILSYSKKEENPNNEI